MHADTDYVLYDAYQPNHVMQFTCFCVIIITENVTGNLQYDITVKGSNIHDRRGQAITILAQ